MLNVIHLQCIMEDFSTVNYKHSNTIYVPCDVYSHVVFQPSPINTKWCAQFIATHVLPPVKVQSNELNPSYMCHIPETVVICESHETDGVWLISPWYKYDTSHVTHKIQVLFDPFYLIQTWYMLHSRNMIPILSDFFYLIKT